MGAAAIEHNRKISLDRNVGDLLNETVRDANTQRGSRQCVEARYE